MKIQLSDFSYIDRGKRGNAALGKALRFTISIRINLPEEEVGEFAWEGNMAFYNTTGLKWSPPINRFPSGHTQQLHWINPVIYNLILDKLKTRPKLLEELHTPIQKLLRKRVVKEIVEMNV